MHKGKSGIPLILVGDGWAAPSAKKPLVCRRGESRVSELGILCAGDGESAARPHGKVPAGQRPAGQGREEGRTRRLEGAGRYSCCPDCRYNGEGLVPHPQRRTRYSGRLLAGGHRGHHPLHS